MTYMRWHDIYEMGLISRAITKCRLSKRFLLTKTHFYSLSDLKDNILPVSLMMSRPIAKNCYCYYDRTVSAPMHALFLSINQWDFHAMYVQVAIASCLSWTFRNSIQTLVRAFLLHDEHMHSSVTQWMVPPSPPHGTRDGRTICGAVTVIWYPPSKLLQISCKNFAPNHFKGCRRKHVNGHNRTRAYMYVVQRTCKTKCAFWPMQPVGVPLYKLYWMCMYSADTAP